MKAMEDRMVLEAALEEEFADASAASADADAKAKGVWDWLLDGEEAGGFQEAQAAMVRTWVGWRWLRIGLHVHVMASMALTVHAVLTFAECCPPLGASGHRQRGGWGHCAYQPRAVRATRDARLPRAVRHRRTV